MVALGGGQFLMSEVPLYANFPAPLYAGRGCQTPKPPTTLKRENLIRHHSFGASASIRDTVRAPYNTARGRDYVKSLRLCLHGTCTQRSGCASFPAPLYAGRGSQTPKLLLFFITLEPKVV